MLMMMRKRPVQRPHEGPWPFLTTVYASGRTVVWVAPVEAPTPKRVKSRKAKQSAPKKLRKRLTKRLQEG